MSRPPAVTLTEEERRTLESFGHRGKANARTLTRARILLKISVACSPSPDEHDHWTVRLLAQKAVELGFVSNISPTTIHDLLKKTS